MPLLTGIITENVTLQVEEERTTKDATTGRNVPGFATILATGVSAFLGLPAGGRAEDFLSAHETTTARLVSSSPYVGRSDVRFKVTAVTDAGLAVLLNVYFRVVSSVDFPQGSLGIIPVRYEAQVSVFAVPT